jgi:anti-sigma factor ChrR (cupin superfamily)
MSGIQFEVIEHGGVRYAEVIWAPSTTEKTRFCSPDDGSMQFGLLAHEAGFIEPAHYHKPIERTITNLAQMFVVQKGKIAVDFFTAEGKKFREVVLGIGDAILLIDGAHAIRVLEDMQCVSVKQGPFLGAENDKINIKVVE